jgi:hypothetical protein
MSEEVTYELATIRWRRTDTVQMVSILDTDRADFPLSFLASCGDNTWQYVLDVIHLLVESTPEVSGALHTAEDTDDNEHPVDLARPPQAGRYRFKHAFKPELMGRDSACLLTEKHIRNCVAAHIVPQSRPDVYDRLSPHRSTPP